MALGDEVGALLKARAVAVLIGERPGLSSPDSLGIYLTFEPRPGRSDAERNCISNIRAAGLTHERAAFKLHWLLAQALPSASGRGPEGRERTGFGIRSRDRRPAGAWPRLNGGACFVPCAERVSDQSRGEQFRAHACGPSIVIGTRSITPVNPGPRIGARDPEMQSLECLARSASLNPRLACGTLE